MTPEKVVAILTTLSVMCPDVLSDTSPEELQEALEYAINAVRQENWRNIDGIEASTKVQADDCMWCDEGFFTREDAMEFIETPLEDFIADYTSCENCELGTRCYIDGNNLEVDCLFDDWEFTLKTTIDFRKIKKPSDLGKYLPILKDQFVKEYNEVGESYYDVIEEKTGKKHFDFWVKRYNSEPSIETLYAESWQEAVDSLNQDEYVEWWNTTRE